MVFGRVMNFVKDGIQEMLIQRPDDKKSLIVYKHPENTIPTGAQLTVDADEAAVFFRDGGLVGALRTAGVGQRHTLTSQNIPILGRLVDNVTGGNIFVTDLYFVTMRPIYGQRFGGALGYIEDPMLGEMVSPRIFGEYAFRIFDPERFIVNYVGLQNAGSNEDVSRWLTGKFMNSVTTVIGEVMESEQKSILQLMRLQQQLAQTFLQRCPDLNDIGVQITDVGEFRVNLDEAEEAQLKAAQAEIGTAKRQARAAQIGIGTAQAQAAQKQFELDQKFQQDARYVQGLAGGNFGAYAAGAAMMGAGEGMAKGGGEGGGGGMMAGAGLGAGFGMANMMMGAMQQPGQPGQQAPQQPQAPVAAGGTVTCPGCRANVAPGKFCAECGTSLSPAPKFCPGCGTQGQPGAKFCANCGTGYPA